MEFKTEKNGYNREQIDSYINVVAAEYEKLQERYKELLEKNKNLLASSQETRDDTECQCSTYKSRIKDLEAQSEDLNRELETAKSGSTASLNTEMITNILIDAEVLAKQIVDRAQQEAYRKTCAANKELEKITAARKHIHDDIGHIQAVLDVFREKEV